MDREAYWNNNYIDYWVKATSESNEGGKTSVPPDTSMNRLIKEFLAATEGGALLDLGCSYCRFYGIVKDYCEYYGADISEQTIEYALGQHPELKERLYIAPAERLPFESEAFDIILVLGTFDACYQETALFEALRILKTGGRLLLTGKNSLYEVDDDEALIAEINARKKEHPNYFTNAKYMAEQLSECCRIEAG